MQIRVSQALQSGNYDGMDQHKSSVEPAVGSGGGAMKQRLLRYLGARICLANQVSDRLWWNTLDYSIHKTTGLVIGAQL
jgi:hypothetical protein